MRKSIFCHFAPSHATLKQNGKNKAVIHQLEIKELLMNKGIKTVVYPVKDIAKAKALFREMLGVGPYKSFAGMVDSRCSRNWTGESTIFYRRPSS
jgi:hypothetical protein